MGVIRIENVDEQTLRSIRVRAEINGRSFDDEVLALLAGSGGVKLSPAERAAEAERIRAMTPKGVRQTDSTDIIRELRDRGYAGR